MKKILTLSLVLLFAFVSFTYAGQTATRAEYEELLKAMQGRWIGEVTWTRDWSGGKRGEKVTGYAQCTSITDGNAMSGVFYGGKAVNVFLIYYDANQKQIKWVEVGSDGNASTYVYYKKDGVWHYTSSGSLSDGSKTEGKFKIDITDGGNTHIRSGIGTVNGEKMAPYKDIWRRVAK